MTRECHDFRIQLPEWVYWLVVAFLFFAQTLGALVIIRLWHIRIELLERPLLLLSSAGILSLVFARYSTHYSIHSGFRWIPVVLYATFIFLLSNRSFNVRLPVKSDYFHPVEYAMLGIFLFLAWTTCHPKMKAVTVLCTVLFSGLIYGAADEFHQSFIPGRDPSVLDVMYDGLGLVIGTALAMIATRVFLKRFSVQKPDDQPNDAMSVHACDHVVHHDAGSPVNSSIHCSDGPRLPDVEYSKK